MFPDITRSDADKDMIHYIEYLFNYGFYKFGVEVSLTNSLEMTESRYEAMNSLHSSNIDDGSRFFSYFLISDNANMPYGRDRLTYGPIRGCILWVVVSTRIYAKEEVS